MTTSEMLALCEWSEGHPSTSPDYIDRYHNVAQRLNDMRSQRDLLVTALRQVLAERDEARAASTTYHEHWFACIAERDEARAQLRAALESK